MADPVRPVNMLAEAALPTRFGEFRVAVFEVDGTPGEAVALMRGPARRRQSIPLVRLHSECLTGDVLGSMRCDCGQQLNAALALIAEAPLGRAAVPAPGGPRYRPGQQDSRVRAAGQRPGYRRRQPGAGLARRPSRVRLGRGHPAQLGLRQVRLLTNNPLKSAALERHGVQVVERVPIAVPPNAVNRHYLRTKADRMGHLLAFEL